MKKLDVLSIGDIVIDAFIRLKDAEETCDIDKQNCKLCVRFGDKVPYESVDVCLAVGNAPNAAVSVARLGLNSGLLTYVGGDQNGRDCIDQLVKNGVITDYVHTEADMKTNYHYVIWYDVDRTILIKHEAFNYSTQGLPTGDMAPKWIYLSSLGANSLNMYAQIEQYLKENPRVKLAFQPGIFDIKQGYKNLKHIYSRADIMCCNVEEAQRILSEASRDIKTLLKSLRDTLGTKTIIMTDSIEGAYAYDGADFYFIPVYPHEPFERTGAGDAFFSTIVAGLSMGKKLDEVLLWAPINSMSVVQQIGAQRGLLTMPELQDFLSKAPADFKVKKI
ncbi:MAG: carbohydrate kinase family protein [bacterium]